MIPTLFVVLILLFCLFLPGYLVKWSKALGLNKIFSDILVCFGIGMLLGNTKPLWLYSWTDSDLSSTIVKATNETAEISSFVAVLLAIPMLLMINHVSDWLKYTGKTMLIFFMGVISALVVTVAVGYFYSASLAEVETASGMMAGVYIGGTPNMVAVSKALNANDALFGILNTTDILCSGLYLFFLLSLAKPLFRFLLPKFVSKLSPEEINEELDDEETHPFPPKKFQWKLIRPLLIATGIALGVVVLSAVPAILIPDTQGKINQMVLFLVLTGLSIGLSFSVYIRKLEGVFNFAQYLLLIFALAVGYMADFAEVIDKGGDYLMFNAIIIVSIVSLHLLLAVLFRSDVDSFIIASTASILGPPFIGQVAGAIKNRELIPVGIALGLLGLTIGNFCGIFVSWLVGLF